MAISRIDYKGIDVPSPLPTGTGGDMLVDDLKIFADRAPTEYTPAGADPTVNNDSSDTAALGIKFYKYSKWINTTSGAIWMCRSAAAGAADWVRIDTYAVGGGGGTLQPTGLTARNIRATDEGLVAGNARGENSVDLQTKRTNANEVASAIFSGILSGEDNMAADWNSVVCGGLRNISGDPTVATGRYAFVGGGGDNGAKANYAAIGGGNGNDIVTGATGGFIGGGWDNGVSGLHSGIGCGRQNAVSGDYAGILSGYYGVADKYGQQSHASGQFAAAGDAQSAQFNLRNVFTHGDSAWRTLYLDGTAANLKIAVDTAITFAIIVTGVTQGLNKTFHFMFQGGIKNVAGTTTLKNVTGIIIDRSDDTSFAARVIADDTNDALVVQVRDNDGNGDIVRWHARVVDSEAGFPA